MRLDDLFAIKGNPPTPIPVAQGINDVIQHQVAQVWRSNYAQGFDRLLETSWFVQRGEQHVFEDPDLVWEFTNFYMMVSDPSQARGPTVHSQEARLIWRLAKLCQTQILTPNGTSSMVSDEADQASRRLLVVEAILTGNILDVNPLPSSMHFNTPVMPTLSLQNQLEERQLEFWHCMGQFASTPINDNTAPINDATLGRARMVLDSYENRDVLYSIAVVRQIGERYGAMQDPQSDRQDRAAYFVARGFVETEAMSGSSQVFQRLGEMAIRLWTD